MIKHTQSVLHREARGWARVLISSLHMIDTILLA